MIRQTTLFILFSILLVLPFSCNQTKKKEQEKEEARLKRTLKENPIDWDIFSIDTVATYSMAKNDVKVHLKLDLQISVAYENDTILKKISKYLLDSSLGENYGDTTLLVSDVVNKYVADYFNAHEARIKKQEGKHKGRKNAKKDLAYFYDLKTEILYDAANLISYQITSSQEEQGGSNIHVKNVLIDLTDGRLLKEEDLFEDNYSDKLNQELVKQILSDHNIDSLPLLQSQGYWGVGDLEAKNNFYIDRNSIVYTFNPGEYAEIEKGILKIAVNLDSLTSILKQESPISILISE